MDRAALSAVLKRIRMTQPNKPPAVHVSGTHTHTECLFFVSGNDTGTCVVDQGDSADSSMNCSWTRVSELCTVVETVAAGGSEGDSGDDKSSPEFSQAKFDMSSFIGGIILVLCLQAGGFFAMRFLKSKEQSNYDPIEQPQ
ncbi:CD164 sialomucin-like 2 protein [Nematolebias whitei]|uniref:CD164 sialomucin-like 2 protein n=1 Tax=Nematolebias whitei TaxID=451745 RepID=UPI00189B2BD9|nr:CD164 sialomucin-like 2 protein [Nematolebias whitei]